MMLLCHKFSEKTQKNKTSAQTLIHADVAMRFFYINLSNCQRSRVPSEAISNSLGLVMDTQFTPRNVIIGAQTVWVIVLALTDGAFVDFFVASRFRLKLLTTLWASSHRARLQRSVCSRILWYPIDKRLLQNLKKKKKKKPESSSGHQRPAVTPSKG